MAGQQLRILQWTEEQIHLVNYQNGVESTTSVWRGYCVRGDLKSRLWPFEHRTLMGSQRWMVWGSQSGVWTLVWCLTGRWSSDSWVWDIYAFLSSPNVTSARSRKVWELFDASACWVCDSVQWLTAASDCVTCHMGTLQGTFIYLFIYLFSERKLSTDSKEQ